MYISPDELRSAIVREAYEWIGTPYGNGGAIKGPNGCVDCLMLLICVYSNVGAREYFDPRPYSSNWHLHQSESKYMNGVERYAKRIADGLPGDFAMYRYGRVPSHSAIIVSDVHVIHAHKRDGQVILCERAALQERLDSCWSVI